MTPVTAIRAAGLTGFVCQSKNAYTRGRSLLDGINGASASVRPLAAAEVHTGAMIALLPSKADAVRLAVADGEPASELHATLRYLGKGADFDEASRKHLTSLVRGYTKNLGPVTADAFNVAMFNPNGDEPCIVLGLSGDGIVEAYDTIAAAVEDYGADLPEPHKPFIPHVTLAYTGDTSKVAELTDLTGPITFDRIRVAFAGQHTDIPLTPATARGTRRIRSKFDPSQRRDDHGRWSDGGDPLGIAATKNGDGLVGSARIGDDSEQGVNLYASIDDGTRYLVIENGTRADADRWAGPYKPADPYEPIMLTDEQIPKVRKALKSAINAAETGGKFDKTVDGEDVGDIRIFTDGDKVNVSVFSYTLGLQEEDNAENRAAALKDWQNRILDPFQDKAEILGRDPVRSDFGTDAEFQDYLEGVAGFDTEAEYLESVAADPFVPEEFWWQDADMLPIPVASLTVAQARDLDAAIERLATGEPMQGGRAVPQAAMPTFFALASRTSARLAGKFDPNQPRGDDGKWTDGAGIDLPDAGLDSSDDDEDDSPADLKLIRNERVGTGSDYNIGVMTDVNGTYGPKGGRVIGLAEDSGRKDWESDGLEDEAWDIPERDADAVATALEAMAQQADAWDGESDGHQVLGTAEAGGYHFAAMSDGENPFVAMSFAREPVDWSDPVAEGHSFGTFTPGDAADIAATVRKLRTAGARERTADPKLDKANLDGRLELGRGEKLVGSQKVRTDDGGDAVLASIATPSGPALAVIPADEEFRRWEGDPPVTLEGTNLIKFRENVAALPQRRREALKRFGAEYRATDDAGEFDYDYSSDTGWVWHYDATEEQKARVMRLVDGVNGEPIERGVLASGPWGELRYSIDGPRDDGPDDDDNLTLDNSYAGADVWLAPPGSPPDYGISDAIEGDDPSGVGFAFTPSQLAKFVKAVEAQALLAETGGNS